MIQGVWGNTWSGWGDGGCQRCGKLHFDQCQGLKTLKTCYTLCMQLLLTSTFGHKSASLCLWSPVFRHLLCSHAEPYWAAWYLIWKLMIYRLRWYNPYWDLFLNEVAFNGQIDSRHFFRRGVYIRSFPYEWSTCFIVTIPYACVVCLFTNWNSRLVVISSYVINWQIKTIAWAEATTPPNFQTQIGSHINLGQS